MIDQPPAFDQKAFRLALTVPPAHFRAGNERNQMWQQVTMLQNLGHTLHQVDTTPFLEKDAKGIAVEVRKLREFGPDIAFGTPNVGYVLMLEYGSNKDGSPGNLFADALGIPTILLWDDPSQIVGILEGTMTVEIRKTEFGVVERVRRVLDNPRFLHAIYDSGHLAIMRELGMLTTEHVTLVPSSAHPRFVAFGRSRERPTTVRRTAFAGNLLLADRARAHGLFGNFYKEIEGYAIARKVNDAGLSIWRLMNEALGRNPASALADAVLVPDNQSFWQMYRCLAGSSANSLLRLALLRSIRQPVDVFGMFADDVSKHFLANISHLRYGGFLDVATEMPAMYATTEITLDWVNAIFIDAYTTKNVNCLAAGGFPLLSLSRNFADWFGDLGRNCQFANPQEAADKVDYFLSHPKEREEIAKALQEKVLAEFTMEGMFARLIAKAAEMIV